MPDLQPSKTRLAPEEIRAECASLSIRTQTLTSENQTLRDALERVAALPDAVAALHPSIDDARFTAWRAINPPGAVKPREAGR